MSLNISHNSGNKFSQSDTKKQVFWRKCEFHVGVLPDLGNFKYFWFDAGFFNTDNEKFNGSPIESPSPSLCRELLASRWQKFEPWKQMAHRTHDSTAQRQCLHWSLMSQSCFNIYSITDGVQLGQLGDAGLSRCKFSSLAWRDTYQFPAT